MKWADRESKIGAMRPLADTFTEFKYKHVIDQPWWEPLDVIFEDKTWIIVTSCQLSYGGLIKNEKYWVWSKHALDPEFEET